jgi:MHS family proline/betaine transporter-like MFS transporter
MSASLSSHAVGAPPLQASPLSGARTIVASVIGNVLEWYDFAVYGYFATAIGAAFFPADDPVASTLAAFGVFAAGFIARPVGGVIFGHIGDRLGRTRALMLSITLMAIPTVLIGFLPTHAQIGPTAAGLLILLRVLQGLSVGGEFTTSIVYVVERAEPHRRGLVGSAAMIGATSGILLGSAVGALIATVLDQASLNAWGWRIPFILGIVVAIFGVLLRRQLTETMVEKHSHGERAPLWVAIETEWRTLLWGIVFCLASGPIFYLLFVYVVSYLETLIHVPSRVALDINTVSMLGLIAFLAIGGAISDRIGRKPPALIGAAGLALLSWPLFRLFQHGDWRVMLAAQLAFAALVGLYVGTLAATMVEILPKRIRCTGLALSYNISVVVFVC